MTTAEILDATRLAAIYAEDGARESAIAVILEAARRLEADHPLETARIREVGWRSPFTNQLGREDGPGRRRA